MQFCLIDREGFLDWLGGKPAPKPVNLTAAKMRQPLQNDIALIYEDPKATLLSHPVIAVQQDKISDFYAFVGTYVTGYRPFSAFFKVIPFEILSEITTAGLNEHQLSPPIQRLIGVAIAEVYTQSRARSRVIDKISVSAVQATLSASLAEAVWQGYGSDRIDYIASRWQTARDLEDSGELFLKPQKVTEVWRIVSDALSQKALPKSRDPQRKIAKALGQALFSSHPNQEWLSPFMKEFPRLSQNASGLNRSREERVRIVREILPELMESSSDTLTREFLAGTIISMIGNGSFAQISLLDDVLPKLPSAALWFGLMSSFQNGSDALTVGNCLGRRVIRDMSTSVDLFAPIREDIAIEELAIFREEAKSAPTFRTGQASSMIVNLLANVNGRFKMGSSNNNETDRLEHDAQVRKNQDQAHELMYLLDKARHVAGRLVQSNQRDLFDEK